MELLGAAWSHTKALLREKEAHLKWKGKQIGTQNSAVMQQHSADKTRGFVEKKRKKKKHTFNPRNFPQAGNSERSVVLLQLSLILLICSIPWRSRPDNCSYIGCVEQKGVSTLERTQASGQVGYCATVDFHPARPLRAHTTHFLCRAVEQSRFR